MSGETGEARLTLVVALFVVDGHEAEFERFESAAATIMARYGGVLERRIACGSSSGEDGPHEVHIVTFPDRQAFERYRDDADLRAMTEIRERTIGRTIVWTGVDLPRLG
ncbi:MAG TPA: DUF1330 domain-containing protein [Candidatus Binataceae bacterium]|nr:DUF1330 domain-containing protein [Candidatus Binataceae bacterium]